MRYKVTLKGFKGYGETKPYHWYRVCFKSALHVAKMLMKEYDLPVIITQVK